jgi:hypothetical protein
MHAGMMSQVRRELYLRRRENYLQQRDVERAKLERVRKLMRARKLYMHRVCEIDQEIEEIIEGR